MNASKILKWAVWFASYAHNCWLNETKRKGRMKYLDTGSRDPQDALATWLASSITAEVLELRIQSGFFAIQSIGVLASAFQRAERDAVNITLLIGSNDGETLASHIEHLVKILSIPRQTVKLGIVSFGGGGYFHPKTYHIKRADGSQAAYVGSANLTKNGLARHVEAGILLDSRDGDDQQTLDAIVAAVDIWFTTKRAGLYEINGSHDIQKLLTQGVLSLKPAPRTKKFPTTGATPPIKKVSLGQIVGLPDIGFTDSNPEQQEGDLEGGETGGLVPAPAPIATPVTLPASAPAPALVAAPVSTPAPSPVPTSTPALASSPAAAASNTVSITGYPSSVRFAKSSTSVPPKGKNALSTDKLPPPSIGVIFRLNKDSARRFESSRAVGTAYFSLPIPYVTTLVFSLWAQNISNKSQLKPRAEFELRVRYITDSGEISRTAAETNVTLYGYGQNPSGQPNLRMLVPTAVRNILPALANAKILAPADDDLAALEWPTQSEPAFKLTLMPNGSNYANSLKAKYQTAEYFGEIVGATCLLLPGILPSW